MIKRFLCVGRAFFACSNEPCVDKPDGGRRELAHSRRTDGLDTYGECRDSEQPEFAHKAGIQNM